MAMTLKKIPKTMYTTTEKNKAIFIDKDGTPKWRPGALADVRDKDIDAYFAPLADKELPL